MCYFLLNILSICKGFLSYSAFQFSPVSATWGILLLYPMCVVNNQIKKTCLSLGAGWRTLWFYLLYFFLFKCLCFLATICIFFQFLLNMIRIYICCLNSCDAKILLGPILWYIHECALQTTHIPGVSVEFAVSLHMAFWVQRNLYMNKECRTGHMLDYILIKHLLCFKYQYNCLLFQLGQFTHIEGVQNPLTGLKSVFELEKAWSAWNNVMLIRNIP